MGWEGCYNLMNMLTVTIKNKGSLTLQVGCGARGHCWLMGDDGGAA